MSRIRFEQTKFATFIKKRGTQISLALVMFAVGIGSYAVYSGNSGTAPIVTENESLVNSKDTTPSKNSYTQSLPSVTEREETTKSQNDTPVEKVESNVEDQTTASFFVLPVTSGEILKECDLQKLQYSNTFEDWRLHTAVDFAALPGSAVKSAGHGIISEVYYDNSYGNTVVINHGNGILGYYSGLNASPGVKKGDRVSAGYQIGVIDTVPCESVDAPHLHLWVTVDGAVKDPMQIMKFTGTNQ